MFTARPFARIRAGRRPPGMVRPLALALVLGLSSVAPMAAHAAPDYAAQVTGQLRDQGYRRIEVSRTLLGKIVITAEGKGHSREVVIDPRNGALLRDLVRQDRGGSGGSVGLAVVDDDNSGSGSGSGSGGDDDDDDDKDDDDDNSGHGGGGDDGLDDDDNSGSGSDDDDDSDNSGSGGGGDDSDDSDSDSDSDDSDRDDD